MESPKIRTALLTAAACGAFFLALAAVSFLQAGESASAPLTGEPMPGTLLVQAGDINGDGCVDGRDMIILGLSYGCCKAGTGCEAEASKTDACYNASADIASDTANVTAPDGKVNLADFNELSARFGEGSCS